MRQIELRFLGLPQIAHAGNPVDFGTRKAVALLAYVAATGQAHTRDALVSLLWPEYEQDRALAALRTTLWTLRKALGNDTLTATRQHIGLNPSAGVWIDVQAFLVATQDALTPGQPQSAMIDPLEEAAALYKGDFLAGFSLKDSLEFDEWQLMQTEMLRRQFIQNLKMLIQCHTAQGTLPAAIGHAHTLLSQDLLDEETHRHLMQLYAWAGQRAYALRQFEECQQILKKELGVEPSEETRDLHEAIKAEAFERTATSELIPPTMDGPARSPDTGPLIRSDLKARLYHRAETVLEKPRCLVGRDPLIQDIHQLLDDGEPVLLHGLGGMGKTSLAATIAAQRIATHQQAVLWLEVGNADADTLFEAMAAPFGQQQDIARKTGDDRVVAVRELLLEQGALLVLDNVWDDRALFQLMKAVPPGLPVIATSRHPIPMDGEVIPLSELTPESALELLTYHARQDFAHDKNAGRLCNLLGYHPFALEIAGRQLKLNPQLTPAAMMDNIADTPHGITMPGGYAEFGREAVKDLWDSSVSLLDDDARALLVAMGAMFAPFASIELLARVIGRSRADIEPALVDLQQQGLSRRIPARPDTPEHYRIHDLTFSYARAMFHTEQDDRRGTIGAVRQFVADHAHDFDGLEFEQANILGAVTAAHRVKDHQASLDILSRLALDGYLDARGYTPLLLTCLNKAIDIGLTMGPDQHETLHYLLSKQGNAFANTGDFDRALEAYQMALKLAPNPHREAILLCVIGGMRFRQGETDYDQYLEQANKIAETENDDLILSRVLDNRGIFALARGDRKGAYTFHSRAVEVAEQSGDIERLVFSLYNLGIAQVELSHHQQALAHWERVYQLGQESGNHLWIAMALSGMARSHHGLGERKPAQDYLEQALKLYQKVGDTAKAGWVIDFMKQEHYSVPATSN